MESFPLKAEEDTSSTINVHPSLSPEISANLLQEPWPQLEVNTQIKSTTTFWEENFQDLSNWCVVDPQKVNPVHAARPTGQPAFPKHQDYHIGEETKSKNSGVKDNYDNLSHIKSESKDITQILGGSNWTVDKNIISTEGGMPFDGSLPMGQDEFNTITEISDIWIDQPMGGTNNSARMDDKQHNITYSNNRLLISNIGENENPSTDHHGVDTISETIGNWLPIDITDQNISVTCNDLVTNMNIQLDDNIILNDHESALVNFTNDNKLEEKRTPNDILFTTDVGSESFDLLSYVCDEGGNLQESKDADEENKKSNTSDKETKTLKIENVNNNSNINNDTRKSRKEKRITRVREKIEPYIPPVRIDVRNDRILSIKKSRTKTSSKQTDQESYGNYTDSGDSDTTHTSDYNYRELREKNNMASRKSRKNKKVKESEMLKRADDLERNNAVLKMKVEELEKLVTSMRTALLQSALKKETN